ncbi:Formylmethanofuran dehydrogenase subunit E region [Syntrophobacter sp. SbD1]|nr:Formylmethanofuran dehydrogenase subunit E region [Syntrophobacter sp. SbD1]
MSLQKVHEETIGLKPPLVKVCGRSIEEFLDAIEKFHGWKAPGLVIGGFMVDWAQELIGPGIEADAIVETCHCLPDAIQLFTPCTCGNGWMKILDWDKFALSLYDKKRLEGFRIWLDLRKTALFPNIYNWFMRLVPKKSLPLQIVLEDIIAAGRSILSSAPVQITKLHGKKNRGITGICSGCGEAYPLEQGEQCLSCQGMRYFDLVRRQ